MCIEMLSDKLLHVQPSGLQIQDSQIFSMSSELLIKCKKYKMDDCTYTWNGKKMKKSILVKYWKYVNKTRKGTNRQTEQNA